LETSKVVIRAAVGQHFERAVVNRGDAAGGTKAGGAVDLDDAGVNESAAAVGIESCEAHGGSAGVKEGDFGAIEAIGDAAGERAGGASVNGKGGYAGVGTVVGDDAIDGAIERSNG